MTHLTQPIDWSPLASLIAAHTRFVISSHVRPDADALGSELGMLCVLQALGKSATIINTSSVPPHLRFLDPRGEIRTWGDPGTAEQVAQAEVHLIVDTSSWAQLSDVGAAMRNATSQRAVIDHHVSTDDLGALMFKQTSRESTGSLILEFSEFVQVPLDEVAARAVYAAIATDTGWFRFPATSGDTLRSAAKLLDVGVEPAAVYRELYEQTTLGRLHLSGRLLSRVTLDGNGQLAYTYALWSDFGDLSALPSDTEDLVNECLRISGTRAAFIAIGLANGQVKVSFRSRCEVDVAKIAESFNGGGHTLAAGATLPGPVPVALERAREAMLAALAQADTAIKL